MKLSVMCPLCQKRFYFQIVYIGPDTFRTDYFLLFYGRFNSAIVLNANRKLLIDCVFLSCAYISGW